MKHERIKWVKHSVPLNVVTANSFHLRFARLAGTARMNSWPLKTKLSSSFCHLAPGDSLAERPDQDFKVPNIGWKDICSSNCLPESTFWLSKYQMTLELDKHLAKASKARQTALGSLQVEICSFPLGTNSDKKNISITFHKIWDLYHLRSSQP